MVLDMLVACKYRKEVIFKQISFIMSDSPSYNLGVIEVVCEKATNVLPTLLCTIHLLMMFIESWRNYVKEHQVQTRIFPIKAVQCLSNFICKDFCAKPWNNSTHYSNFIYPKQNVTFSLKILIQSIWWMVLWDILLSFQICRKI